MMESTIRAIFSASSPTRSKLAVVLEIAISKRKSRAVGWRRAMILMGSAKAQELADAALPPWKLVDRLFLAEGVEIYRPMALAHRCRCDPARMRQVLRTIPRAELETMREPDGAVHITCEFCNTTQLYSDLDALYAPT